MRSIADGQSQNSFSNNSMRYLGGSNAYTSDLVNSRPGKLTRLINAYNNNYFIIKKRLQFDRHRIGVMRDRDFFT